MHVIIAMWAPAGGYEYRVKDAGPVRHHGKDTAAGTDRFDAQVGPDFVTVTEVRFDRELKEATDFDSVAVLFEGRIVFDELEVVV